MRRSRSSSATSPSSAPTGSSSSTIARRTASTRSFFRHQQLLGARGDNPAAAVALPRRTKPLPKTLSPGEAERLIEAAAGTQPRSLRDQALVELLYGAGLRVSEAVGLDKAGDRPRRPARPRDRQGRQGTGRPDRPPRRRGAPPLPLARAPVPRPPPPARALPERPRRPSDPGRGLPDPPQARREGRPRPAPRPPAPPAPLLRHAPAGGRRRPQIRSRNARPCRSFDNGAVHPRNRSATSGVVLPSAPPRSEEINGGTGCRSIRTSNCSWPWHRRRRG